MSEQILPSQALLVMDSAQLLEQVIHQHQEVVWDDPKKVDAYMSRLLNVAAKLTSRNSFLRAAHLNMASEVCNCCVCAAIP